MLLLHISTTEEKSLLLNVKAKPITKSFFSERDPITSNSPHLFFFQIKDTTLIQDIMQSQIYHFTSVVCFV